MKVEMTRRELELLLSLIEDVMQDRGMDDFPQTTPGDAAALYEKMDRAVRSIDILQGEPWGQSSDSTVH